MSILSRILGWDDADFLATLLAANFERHASTRKSSNALHVDKAYGFVLAQAKGEIRKKNASRGAIARVVNTFGWKLVERGFLEAFALSLSKNLSSKLRSDDFFRGQAVSEQHE